MRPLSELRINHGGAPVSRPRPTPKQIKRFERHFGVELPSDYLSLLVHANGGHPELDSVACIESGVNHFCHLDDDTMSPESVWSATTAWRTAVGIPLVVFAEDGGGNAYILDYRDDPPSVKFIDHEGMAVHAVAPDFSSFIDLLEPLSDAI